MSNPFHTVLLSLVAATGFASSANAQGFNIDFDASLLSTCPSSYAAAGTAGTWNSAEVSQGSNFNNLLDKSGAATGVNMTLSSTLNITLQNFNTNYAGDDALLMQDICYGGQVETIDFTGLANGLYDIYTYAQAPDDKIGLITDVDCTNSSDGIQAVGGSPWTGSHVLGTSYALHHAVVTNGTLHLDISVNTIDLSVNGIQIEITTPENSGSAFCFGDGTGAICPCSGFGALGAGCANTSGFGAVLASQGTAVLSADSFGFNISGIPGAKPGLLLRGDNAIANPIGDGIICTAGNSQRSHVQVTSAMGMTTFTDFNGSPFGSIANAPGTPTQFQFWYRDPSNPCSGSGFNFSNAWTVSYLP